MIPKHYSLAKEHPHSYEIHDQRDGKRFHVAKHGLSLAMHGELSKIKHYAEGTPDEPVQDQPMGPMGPMASISPPSSPGVMDTTGVAPTINVPSPEVPATNLWQPPQTESNAPTMTEAPPAPVSDTAALANQAFDMNTALQAEKDALKAGAGASSAEGYQTAKAYKDFNEKLDALPTPQQIMAGHQEADKNLFDSYMKKEIEPDHYWHNKGTGSKISAGLGMILGGIGSGMTGGPNYAFETIQKAIDRDIDSQKQDQSRNFNLWKMNREATHDDISANLATQNQMLTAVKSKALQFQSESAGPLAKARIAPVILQIDQQMAANNFKRSVLGASQNGQKLDMDPSHLLGSIPEGRQAEAAKEIQTHQQLKALHDDIVQNAELLRSKFMNGLLSPNDRKALIDPLASRLDVITDHRFSLEASKQKIDAMMPEPSDFGKETAKDKARAREYFFRDQMQAPTFKGFTGIGLDRFKSTSLAEPKQAPNSTESYRQYVAQNEKSTDPKVRQRVNFIRGKYNF